MDDANRQFEWVSSNSSEKLLVLNLCCIYAEVMSCINEKTATEKGCDREANTSKRFASSVEYIFVDNIDFMCGRYQYKEDCERDNPEGLKQLRLVAATESEPNYNSSFLVGPYLDIIDRLAGKEKGS